LYLVRIRHRPGAVGTEFLFEPQGIVHHYFPRQRDQDEVFPEPPGLNWERNFSRKSPCIHLRQDVASVPLPVGDPARGKLDVFLAGRNRGQWQRNLPVTGSQRASDLASPCLVEGGKHNR
jgi:hypothetical protein